MSTLLSFVCTKCRTWKGVRRIVCPFSEHWPGHSRAPYGHLRTCLYGRLFGHRSSSDEGYDNETSLSANRTKIRAVLIVIMSAISSSWLVYLVTVFVLPYCSHRLSKEENDMSRHPAHRLPVKNKPESKIGYGSIHVPAASLHLGLCRDR